MGKLYKDYQISMRGTVELTHLIKEKCAFYKSIDCKTHNIHRLDQLCSLMLKIKMKKSKKITLSNWENPKLTKQQILYAADDAIISFFIFIQCIHHRFTTNISMIRQTNALKMQSFDIDTNLLSICSGIIDVKIIKMEQKINRKQKMKQIKSINPNNSEITSQQKRILLKQKKKKKKKKKK